MYSSDRIKTSIRIVKDYDKNIVFRDCQLHSCLYLFEKKGDPFDFLPSFCWIPYQHLYMIKRYWNTFETLAEIERDFKERLFICAWDIAISNAELTLPCIVEFQFFATLSISANVSNVVQERLIFGTSHQTSKSLLILRCHTKQKYDLTFGRNNHTVYT